jgi:hypothetical protein
MQNTRYKACNRLLLESGFTMNELPGLKCVGLSFLMLNLFFNVE